MSASCLNDLFTRYFSDSIGVAAVVLKIQAVTLDVQQGAGNAPIGFHGEWQAANVVSLAIGQLTGGHTRLNEAP